MGTHLVAGAAAVGAWIAFLAAWSITIGFLFEPGPVVAIGAFVGATVAAVYTYARVVDSRSEKASDSTKATL